MKECVFCQISRNQSSEDYRIVYSDSDYIAMLVSHPETDGHFIFFPKTHFSEIVELQSSETFFKFAISIAEKMTKKLGAKAYTIKLNNNVFLLDDDPLHVGHTHIHVIPRYSKAGSNRLKPAEAEKGVLSDIGRRMR